MNTLVQEIDALRNELETYRPLSASHLQKIEDALFVEYTYESNRIEGSTLTLQETALVIHKGITVSGKSLREHLEAINHFEAIGFIKSIAEKNEPFTERTLKDIHALVLRGIDPENAGKYRRVNVRIAGSRHIPADALKVQELMDDYFQFYEEQKNTLHPVLLSAHLHEKFVTIHPFIDGNGRTARLIMNLILLRHGYTLVNIAGDNESRINYYTALDKCQTENACEEFLQLVMKAEHTSLTSYLNIMKTGKSK
ncbi:MAG: Fic family protein [Ignavibacteriales bacterium]|nr:Fic family protein [Ignavibacteriales bacterium]